MTTSSSLKLICHFGLLVIVSLFWSKRKMHFSGFATLKRETPRSSESKVLKVLLKAPLTVPLMVPLKAPLTVPLHIQRKRWREAFGPEDVLTLTLT